MPLAQLHNRHAGQRCFILGSGPSLTRHDSRVLARLAEEITFGVARLFLWKSLPFTPTYHVISDISQMTRHRWAEMFWPGVQERFCIAPAPIQRPGWTWLLKAPNEDYIVRCGIRGLGETLEPFTNGRTAVLSAVQLALWMGCDRVYLLGVDTTGRGHAWDADDSRNVGADLRVLAEPYRVAAQEMREHGRQLWDCTPGGYLNQNGYLPYIPLEGAVRDEVATLGY